MGLQDATVVPGQKLYIDNIDPSFSRMDEEVSTITGVRTKQVVVPAIGGAVDCVLAIDEGCGALSLRGRISKNKPHIMLGQFLDEWNARWPGMPKEVHADKEFFSAEAVQLLQKKNIRTVMAPVGDHRSNGLIEGAVRWVQDAGQANMNKLAVHVKSGLITERRRREVPS